MFDYADVVVIVLFFMMLRCMFVAAVGNAAVSGTAVIVVRGQPTGTQLLLYW